MDRYRDYAAPANLDESEIGVINQNLLVLLKGAKHCKEEYGAESIEYEMFKSRVADYFASSGGGMNATLQELRLYESKYGDILHDASDMVRSKLGVPITDILRGINFETIVPNKGNADGSPYTRESNNLPSAKPNAEPLRLPNGDKSFDGLIFKSTKMAAKATSK